MSCTIGGLAKTCAVNVETIRYYQRRGLMHEPTKPLGGIRHYTEDDVRRLQFIKRAKSLGFSLDEVGELLHLEDGQHCHDAEKLGIRKLALVRSRIEQLQRVEQALSELVTACHDHGDSVRCPLIATLLNEDPQRQFAVPEDAVQKALENEVLN